MNEQPRGGVESVTFAAAGESLVGILYHAPGAGPHPVAVLLHGIPGGEKNHDIAYALREMGWHALIIHFRGAWGSDGRYDMPGQVEDALGALDWLQDAGNPFPADSQRLALVGFSLGSRAALMASATDARVAAVASISGFATFTESQLGTDFMTASASILRGVTADDLLCQWASLGEGQQPTDAVEQLRIPLLVIHGGADEVIPVAHARALMAHAGEGSSLHIIAGADHLFAAHRREVVDAVTGWLTRTLPG